MNILFMTRKFPPSKGGMQNFAYDLYTSLDERADVQLIKWSGSNKLLPLIVPYFFVKACWIMIRDDVDIIHSQDGVLSVLGFALGRIFRKPYAVVLHGLDITYSNALFQSLIPPFVHKADVVFCISHAAADEAVKRGVNKAKIRVIPLGITDDKRIPREKARPQLVKAVKINNRKTVLLTVGRLVERKGVAWFVESVMPKLVKKYPGVVYLVVGGGEDEARIKESIAVNNLEKNVKLLGQVPDKMLPILYNGADVFVQPNIIVPGDVEGFGRVLLEASLCELPVVATGIEGIRDAVSDGVNGVLVTKPKDVAAFVTKISAFLDDKKYARAFGRKSRTYTLKYFQWSSITEKYLECYNAILRGKSHEKEGSV